MSNPDIKTVLTDEQIGLLARKHDHVVDYEGVNECKFDEIGFARAAIEAAVLASVQAADAKDAQRYRYAVENGVILFDFGSVACVGRAESDKAIDAALQSAGDNGEKTA